MLSSNYVLGNGFEPLTLTCPHWKYWHYKQATPLSIWLLFFLNRISLCSPTSPGTHYVEQADPKLRDVLVSASQMVGTNGGNKGADTMPSLCFVSPPFPSYSQSCLLILPQLALDSCLPASLLNQAPGWQRLQACFTVIPAFLDLTMSQMSFLSVALYFSVKRYTIYLVFSLVVFAFLKLGSAVTQSGLELLLVLPQALQCLVCRCAPSCSVAVSFETKVSVLGSALRAVCGTENFIAMATSACGMGAPCTSGSTLLTP